MQEAIQAFQKQLKTKLQYKASSKISPDSYLYKSFKFFDLYNNGYLGKSDFFKAIAKCGVVVDTHDIQAVYNHYDTHHDGNIHYKQFIQNLLFSQSQQSSQLSESQLMNNRKAEQLMQSRKQNSQVAQSRRTNNNQTNLKESKIDRIYNQSETYHEVTDNIKKNFREKGISSLLNFAVSLKSTDTSKTHRIDKKRLHSKLNFLSQKAINLIISEFSQNHNQQINYAQLIYSLKGQLQQAEQAIIQKAFYLLDTNNQKEIPIKKVVQKFQNISYKTQFIQSIKLYENFQGIDDGVFTDQDFIDFFGFLAFSFSSPQQFINFVQKSYMNQDSRSTYSQKSNRSRQFKQQYGNKNHGMKEILQPDFRKNKEQPRKSVQQKNQNNSNVKQLQLSGDKRSVSRKSHSDAQRKSTTTQIYVKQVQMIVMRIKKRLASKGTKGFLIFQKSLKQVDTDQDGLINLDQFKKVVRDLKIDITNSQSNLLFDVFDPDSTNLISFSQMIHTLKGNVPQKRRQLFERVWNTVKQSEQHTSFTQIRHMLNFRGHPDIQTGRRYDDQIYKQIQQTIFLIQELNQSGRNEQITRKQFEEYLQNLSLSTSEDMLFQSILQNFWKMQSKVNINQLYAGSRKLFDPTAKSYLMDHHRYAVKGGSISSNAPFGTSNQPTSYFTEHGKL